MRGVGLSITFQEGGFQDLRIETNRLLVPLSLKSMATNHRFLFIYLEDRPVYSGAPLHVVPMSDCIQ